MGLALFCYLIFGILGITVWNGRIHFRCYDEEAFNSGEWTLANGYDDLCNEDSQCPTGNICRSRFEGNPNIAGFDKDHPFDKNDPNLWKDTMTEELFWGFNNFDNIGYALLTIFQVMTMDGWTPIMNFHEKAGSPWFSWIFYISTVVVCSFFILNLTVAQMMIKYA